jgi:Integrase core domain
MHIVPMARNVDASCDPHAVALRNMVEETNESGGAAGSPGEAAMQADRDHLGCMLAFGIEYIERVSQIAEEVVRAAKSLRIDESHIVGIKGVRDKYAERLIGALRRECLDHMIVFGEKHLRRILGKYAAYYNRSRIHRALNKDAPFPRAVEHLGVITSRPVLGGLHHQYCRI